MPTKYKDFLAQKRIADVASSLHKIAPVNAGCFDFQADIIRWALKRGRAAIFADCGMGKSLMQLEWARQVPGDVLILAPLAVAAQTVKEGEKFGVKVTRCQTGSDMRPGINITNYERLEKFDCPKLTGVVLDESSILKSLDGKTRTLIIETFARTPFRLACTATPSPNDYMELGNHAQFLGVMTHAEMLAMYFVHDGGETSKWRLKGHGQAKFWEWVCSWAVMIRKPSNLGYSDEKFKLPKLDMQENIVRASAPTEGMLFAMPAASLQERIQARRGTVQERAKKCAALVNGNTEQWLVWCNLNSEADELAGLITDAIEVRGSDSAEDKESAVAQFLSGQARVLITKPSMFGHGLNLQNCAHMAFVGLSDSYEEFYQAVRRCWRFGQKRKVTVHIIIADTEGAVLANIKRKESEAEKMAESMVENMKDISKAAVLGATKRDTAEYKTGAKTGAGWEMRLGDCVEHVGGLKADSIHYTIYSPPFASLYTYSNSDRDMGNSKNAVEFAAHYQFLIRELFRVTMPGRLTSFHCMNLHT